MSSFLAKGFTLRFVCGGLFDRYIVIKINEGTFSKNTRLIYALTYRARTPDSRAYYPTDGESRF